MSDVISGIFVGPVRPDKPVKADDPRLNRSREIPPEAAWGGIFYGFFAVASDRKQLVMSYPVQMQGRSAWMCL